MNPDSQTSNEVLPLARFRFALKATGPIILPPYKGAVFRGAFGGVFRRIVCANPRDGCAGCLLEDRCLYPAVFESRPPPGFPDAEKFTPAPTPFVLNPPLTNRQLFHPDETLTFELVLMGRFIDALPYFVYTFTEIGRRGLGKDRGRFVLDRVDLLDGAAETRIYDGTSRTLSAFPVPAASIDTSPDSIRQITLNLLTPLRIKERGKLVSRLNFPLFFDRLAHRLFLLFGLYGSNGNRPDFAPLLTKSENIRVTSDSTHWYEWERYSARQKASMKMGGIKGEITFTGDLGAFMPWIRLGEQINVGLGTSFGLGRYETTSRVCA